MRCYRLIGQFLDEAVRPLRAPKLQQCGDDSADESKRCDGCDDVTSTAGVQLVTLTDGTVTWVVGSLEIAKP